MRRPAGDSLMYALYSAVALVGLVALFLPVALLRRLTRGVPLNVRARLARDRAADATRSSGWVRPSRRRRWSRGCAVSTRSCR